MSYSIWGAIAETPWWIYLIFLGLLNVAYRSTKPHNVSLKLAIFLPAIINVMLIFGVIVTIHFSLYKFSLFLSMIIPGILLGWLQYRIRSIKVIKNKSQIYIPGTWSLFIILFVLVTAKIYFFGYGFSFSLDVQENNAAIISLLCGLVIGLSIGRTYYLYRCMKVGPFLE